MKKLVNIYNQNKHTVINIAGIKIKIRRKNYTPVNDFEIEFIKANFNDINDINLLEKYRKLINNLDKDDIKTIHKILSAITNLTQGKYINKADYIDDTHEFNPIIKFNENCYLGYDKYYLPINNFDDSVFYYKHGLNAIENFDLIKDKDIIDAGAYIGDSALILSEYTSGKIHSFEPMKKEYSFLLDTIKLNNLTGVIPVNKGLGERNEEININSFPATLKEHKNEIKEKIEITTLDDYVEQNNITIGLIKSDIEGAEQALLRGAEKTIKRFKPVLVLSIYHNTQDFFDIKEVIESWNLGYKFKIKKNEQRILIDTMLICEVR